MSYICLKTTFLHLKHYLQIYLTLLSTTCVKIYQISYVILMSLFTTQLVYIIFIILAFDKNIPSKCKFPDFSLLKLKFINFLMLFFKQIVSFSLNFGSLFSVLRDNSSVLFQLKLYIIWTKGAHESAKFQTFDCSRDLYLDRLLKVYKILAKKYRRVISHDTEDRCKI